MNRTVAITQPYVPAYRVPLFDAVAKRLREQGDRLLVFSGSPAGEQAIRGDLASGTWHRDLPAVELKVLRRSFSIRALSRELRAADLVVSELAALNTIAWQLAAIRRPVILWGHGKPYTSEPSRIADMLEWSLVRRSVHSMTYVESGKQHLIQHAQISSDSVTAIGNSTDTTSLRRNLKSIRSTDWETLEKLYGKHRTAIFVGGIDSSKRIEFMLEAYRAAVRTDPEFQLIVVGHGSLSHLVERECGKMPNLTYVGRATGMNLARLAVASRAMWMPGRVGLAAIDAIALGLQLHTTAYDRHAPEIELLDSTQAYCLADDPQKFAQESLRLMASVEIGPNRPLSDAVPTVELVADNMVAVINKVL